MKLMDIMKCGLVGGRRSFDRLKDVSISPRYYAWSTSRYHDRT